MAHKIPLAGVIGSPVAHSRSPKLHGHWLATFGIAGHYIPIEVKEDDFADALSALPRLGFVGANVTSPYKEDALACANTVTERAKRIGSANTLTFLPDGQIAADNTDGYGFLTNIHQNAPQWSAPSGPVVVLGAGGAARAVVVTLLDSGVPQIILANRTRSRAEALANDLGGVITVIDWDRVSSHLAGAAMLVNTTTLGMYDKPALEVPLDTLESGTIVNDLVYAPLETPLLATAKARGCVAIDGLGMLLHQAVPGFEAWFGARPEVDERTRQAALA